MVKKSGTVLVAVIVIIAVVAMFSGVFETVWPAPRSSPVAQELIGQPANTFPITTLGKLKNEQKKVEVLSATVGVVKGEYDDKINKAQAAYDKLVGSIDKPGMLGTIAVGLMAMYGTALYKNNQLYTLAEVNDAVKNGKTPV